MKRVARAYGVTPQTLKRPAGTPSAAQDKYTAVSIAYDVAARARDACARRYGAFTAPQFQERLYTLGIGTTTTLDVLDAVGKTALGQEAFLGIRARKMPDGTVRYAAGGSKEAAREAERPFRSDTAEAWAELKRAAAGVGAAVLVRTARAGADMLRRLAEAVNPPPRVVAVDARDLPRFLDRHLPTPYLIAHAKALLRGALAPGNPYEKAGAAERAYAALRRHERLPRNAVVVVRDGWAASARELRLLSRVARRDGGSVVLSDREGGRPRRPDRGLHHDRD